MDAKSLARSKRAHSLHHSKKPPHSNPKSRPSGDRSTVAGKKAAEKPVGDTPRNSLLSNWDRYEEEFDPDGGELTGNSSRQLSEVPLPKSKGGDYRLLIDEAQSQPFSPSDPLLDTFPTVDDLFPEFFSRGGGSLLSAQADRILQSVNHESFIVEDKGAPNYEAPLLSLNLNALAEQLSKIDVAKRLFIEPDLLPPPEQQQVEATSTASTSSKNTITEVQKGKSEAALKQLNDFNFDEFDFIKEEKDKNHITEATGKQATSSYPTFKAATAEAELDALLNSFGDTKLHDIDIPIEEDTSAQVLRPGPGSSEPSLAPPPPSSVNIDVLLDDLLEETSKMGNGKGTLVSDRAGSSAPPTTNSRSSLLNDFDSWLDTI